MIQPFCAGAVMPIDGPALAIVKVPYGPFTTVIELPARSNKLVPLMEIPALPLPLQPVILTVREVASVPEVVATQPLLSPVMLIAESMEELESDPKFTSLKVSV